MGPCITGSYADRCKPVLLIAVGRGLLIWVGTAIGQKRKFGAEITAPQSGPQSRRSNVRHNGAIERKLSYPVTRPSCD